VTAAALVVAGVSVGAFPALAFAADASTTTDPAASGTATSPDPAASTDPATDPAL
jgi:hypothetical protein